MKYMLSIKNINKNTTEIITLGKLDKHERHIIYIMYV